MMLDWLWAAWGHMLTDGDLAGKVLTCIGLVMLAAEAVWRWPIAAYHRSKGSKKASGTGWAHFLLVATGWICSVVGVALLWKVNFGIGLVFACLGLGVGVALVLALAVWGSDPQRSWRRWLAARLSRLAARLVNDPDLTAPATTVEVPVVPVEKMLTAEDYSDRFHRVLDALDIPVELNGTHVTIGEITDAEREMVEAIVAIVKTRLPSAEAHQASPTA